MKTRELFSKEEITYLQNQLDNCLRCSCCSSKKENNASIHQKRKPNSVENSSALGSTEKGKDDASKKDNIGEKKQLKRVQLGSNLRSAYTKAQQPKASPKRTIPKRKSRS